MAFDASSCRGRARSREPNREGFLDTHAIPLITFLVNCLLVRLPTST